MPSVEAGVCVPGMSAAGNVDAGVMAVGGGVAGADCDDCGAGGMASSARAEGSDCAHAAEVALNSATLIHLLNMLVFKDVFPMWFSGMLRERFPLQREDSYRS